VNPDDYTTQFTFFALAVLILGGTARIWGPILGAIIFTGALQLIDTLLRQLILAGYIPDWVPFDQNKVGPVRLLLTGLVLMLLMIFRPQGILGDRNEIRISAR
jgi:branched-chain amino acid transport system permease protein